MPLGYCVRTGVRTVGKAARKLVLLSCVSVAFAFSAEAAETHRGVQYHATLMNGQIIGSAFLIAEGVVVTNAHVVKGRQTGDRLVIASQQGGQHSAQIVAISTRMDLAVLRVAANVLPVVPNDVADHAKGARVYAVGVAANSENPQRRYVIAGEVSSDHTAIAPFGNGVIARMPQIKRGFSGGPVFDQQGAIVGMVAALRNGRQSKARDAFILSIAEVRAEVSRMIAW